MLIGIDNYNDLCGTELKKLDDIYDKCDVMITHYDPSIERRHQCQKFAGKITTGFYSFNGKRFLKDGTMKYWIFGHTHAELDFETKGVRCLCNTLGLPSESNNGKLTSIKSFEIH